MKKNKAATQFSDNDKSYMEIALRLSRRGLGTTFPNPSVGCVIVKGSHIIGRGWTGRGGRPHAERQALDNCTNDTSGATAYVTLEPCAHFGKTSPCAVALVEANISKIIIATGDPDPRVSGKGVSILEDAGIDVYFGLLKEEADFINLGFFKKIQKEKPLVTIKIASSADGKISANLGEKTWVTGAEARRRGHLYRANHDAILVGIGTVLIDDPMLDCRIKGLEKRSPVRVLLDSNLRLSENSKFCKSAQKIPLWVMTCSNDQEKIKELENLGLRIFIIDKNDQGKLDLHHVMKVLSEQGITRVLSEGGGQVNASLIKASLVDRFIWFKSRENIGESGVNALYDISINQLDEHLNLSLINQGAAGADNWQEFEIIS